MRKRVLSVFLSLVLVLTGIPVSGLGSITAYAEGETGEQSLSGLLTGAAPWNDEAGHELFLNNDTMAAMGVPEDITLTNLYGNDVGEWLPKHTHRRSFATFVDNEEGATPYTGTLTLKKSTGEGESTTWTETTDGKVEKFQYTAENGTEETIEGVYDVKFNAGARGTYRLYAGDDTSYVTITMAVHSGFYTSSEITDDNLIEEQTTNLTADNRTFYFAYKNESYADVINLNVSFEAVLYGDGEPVDVASGKIVSTKLETTSNDFTVYKLELQDGFETEGTYTADLRAKLTGTRSITAEEGEEAETEPVEDTPTLALRVVKSGLACTWVEWSEEGIPSAPTDAGVYEKNCGVAAKSTATLAFGTLEEEAVTAYKGSLVAYKVTDNNGSLTITEYGGADINPWSGENAQSVSGVYDVYLPEEGTYRICPSGKQNTAGAYVTIHVGCAGAGFFSEAAIKADSYIMNQTADSYAGGAATYYFAYNKDDYPGATVLIQADAEDSGVTIDASKLRTTSLNDVNGYAVWEVELAAGYVDTADLWYNGLAAGLPGIKATMTWTDAEGQTQNETVQLSLSAKKTGLVVADPTGGENPTAPVYSEDRNAYQKKCWIKAKCTESRALGTVNGEEMTLANGDYKLYKVENGSVATSPAGSVTQYKKDGTVVTGIYDIYAPTSGTYRLCKAGEQNTPGSYILVYVERNGFYTSADEITDNGYIENQEGILTESRRTFYFAYDHTNPTYANGAKVAFKLPNGGDEGKLEVSQAVTKGDFTVYTVTLKEGCEGNEDWVDLVAMITPNGETDPVAEYWFGIQVKKTGLVYTWPDYDGETPIAPTGDPYYTKNGFYSDYEAVLYIGMMDENENVTPMRQQIMVSGNGKIEPYAENMPGIYLVTLPDFGEYTFTYGKSKMKITRTDDVKFYTDEACNKPITDGRLFLENNEGTTQDFYVTIEPGEYQYLIMKEEMGGDDKSDLYYFFKGYNDSKINETSISSHKILEENCAFKIDKVQDDETADKSKKYKITVDKKKLSGSMSFAVKAVHSGVDLRDCVAAYVTISKLKTEADTTSTFKGGASEDELVTIEKTPLPEELNGENSEGLTKEQEELLEKGGELSVSIKADTIDVDENGAVKVPEGASEEDKQKAEDTQKAVDSIEETKEEDLSEDYETEYVDLTVTTTVKPSEESSGSASQPVTNTITSTKKPMTIKIPLPKHLRGQDYHFVIIRYHNGTSDVLTVKVENNYLIFETDRFSTYAIAYRTKNTTIDTENLSNLTWTSSSGAQDATTFDCGGEKIEWTYKLNNLPEGYTPSFTGTKQSDGSYVVKLTALTYKDSATGESTTYKVSEFADKLPDSVRAGYVYVPEATSGGNESSGGSQTSGGNSGNTGGGSGSSGGNYSGGGFGGGSGVVTPTDPTDPTDPAEPTKPTEPTEEVVKKGEVKTVDGSKYQITSTKNGKETVAFAGADSSAKSIRIPKTVTINGKTYTVTAIAPGAFSGCKKLTAVTIPNTVTKIGKKAFKGCTALKSVVIPKQVTVIGAKAFHGCKKLADITFMGGKLVKLGSKAFAGIAKNAVIQVPKGAKKAYKELLAASGCKKAVKCRKK